RPDAFVPRPDAFVPRPDAFVPAPDAFVPAPDAFVPPRDAGPDALVFPDEDAGTDASTALDAGAPPGPLTPSTYTYRRIAVGGLREAVAVAFHPDGSYALVLERNDGAHV